MRRTIVRVATAVVLLGLGWMTGRAQTTEPDFELVVDAPPGETNVECRRGCHMAWLERGINPAATPQRIFTFKCGGSAGRCSSYRIGGWLTK
jgi:hypothetical protein